MVPGVDGVGTLEDGSRVYFGFARQAMGNDVGAHGGSEVDVHSAARWDRRCEAAAIANPGMSAWLSLKRARRGWPQGRRAGAGSDGRGRHLAIQAARLLGAERVIGVGRNVESIAAADVDAVIGLNQPEDAVRDAFAAEAAGVSTW